jgi:uncharacterized membrane protein YoaK (UPF0700 family)
MTTFPAELRQMIVPEMGGKHGPLPPLLLAMTFVTGLVDAFSYLILGHVFVANMTGNVILLGFALAGAPGFSIAASVAAIAAFAVGAIVGGQIGGRMAHHRGRLLALATSVQIVFFAASVILAGVSGNPVGGYRYPLIVVLAIAMGVQNAAARKLAVPDMTTTVLTLTITGTAADSTIAGGAGSRSGRRLVTIVAMLAGAIVGAALVLNTEIFYPLLIGTIVTAIVATVTASVGRRDAVWLHPGP